MFLTKRGISAAQAEAIAEAAVDAALAAYEAPAATADAIVSVAVVDTPADQKAAADATGTGTSGSRTDHAVINTKLDAAASTGGDISLLPGNYYLGARVRVIGAGTGAAAKQIALRNLGGAVLNGAWAGIGADDPIVNVESWNGDIWSPTISGSGSKGNGKALALGSSRGSVAISSATRSGSAGNYTLTINTAAPHGLAVGDAVTLDGVSATSYDGSYQVVTVPDNDTFTVLRTTGTPAASASDGSAYLGQTVHNVTVYSPRVSNAHIGLELGIVAGSSSGDNVVWAGYYTSCDIGINSVGFVNSIYSPFVQGNTDGVVIDETRNDSSLKAMFPTILSSTGTYLDVRGGHGTSVYDAFLENSLTSGDAVNGMVRVGHGDVVRDFRMPGTTFMSPGADHPSTDVAPSLFHLYDVDYMKVDGVQLSMNATNPKLPSTALIVADASFTGKAVFDLIRIAPNAIPSIWDPSTDLISNAGSGKIIVKECPAPYRSPTGATIGGDTPIPVGPDYIIDFRQVENRCWFWAKDRDGHLAMIAGDSPQTSLNGSHTLPQATITVLDTTDFASSGTFYLHDQLITYTGKTSTTFTGCSGGTGTFGTGAFISPPAPTSGLKTVMEGLAEDNVWFHLLGKTYRLPVFAAGGAADSDHVVFQNINGLRISGEGDATVVANWGLNDGEDTEPLSIDETCRQPYWHDFTIYAGGTPDSSGSSDALDWDHACEGRAERVKVFRSRGKAFIVDGKDTTVSNNDWKAVATGNVLEGCIARGRPLQPDIQRLGSGSMASGTYYYALSWTDSDLGETICSEASEVTVAASGRARIRWFEGFPQYDAYHGVTALNIYRRSSGQAWRLVTTITNPATRQYDDSAADATIAGNAAPPAQAVTLIPLQGFDVLSGEHVTFRDCIADGVTKEGFRLSRTTSKPAGYQNAILDCVARKCGQAGALIESGIGASIRGLRAYNVGFLTTTSGKPGILVKPARADDTCQDILLMGNQIHDQQTSANSVPGGSTTRRAIVTDNTTAAITDTLAIANRGRGLVTNGILDASTGLVAIGNKFDQANSGTAFVANADTSGATLGNLETEVNELKALLRTAGILHA